MAKSPCIDGLGSRRAEVVARAALLEIGGLKTENAELRDEIAGLKGLKGRPKVAPSGMEQAT